MVKIKRKVEMKHGDFAKYMVDKFGFLSYESKLTEGDYVGSPSSRFDISLHLPSTEIDDLPLIQIMENGVVIETSEEITEDTVIPRLITRNTHGGYNEWTNESVNGFNLTHVEAVYIPNDDLTLTLIWTKDKGLVE
ncbi:hypothetical protein BJG89_10560 [Staphylococcus nepalensis]|uniref:hypothetical protein n=1 Tax=Staphylococcus nepalensis TaxID=214473 RepID=UPI000BC32109|nr:hypothetical protein [Staphylococcus nepalensis]ATH60690.1 hypothetical protein BJD96_10460 [Staphylococcus nepalensis]ATH65737.1 hypothetical protein BJG89_10560 [Staphylococcus nepalensis]